MEQAKPGTQIMLIYFVNYLTNCLINFDHGIIPASTKEMKSDLGLDDFQLGMLGSAVYGGLLTGSLAGSYLFSHYQTKKIVSCSVLCCCISLSIFLYTKSIYILFISRFLVGFFQIFLVVFFPVWVDFHGGNLKTLWLTFMQLGVAIGAVAGYFVTSLFISYSGNWVRPYELQIFLLVPCAFFYMLTPSDLIDTSGRDYMKGSINLQISFKDRLVQVMSNKIFVLSMMGLTSLYFVVTGIQFWVSDYFRNALMVPQQVVFKAYMIVSLSAPILGVALGGLVLHYTGGYDGDKGIQISAIEALLASLCGLPIPFVDNFYVAVVMLWFLLFFGGSIVPGATGIMISAMRPDLRSFGNSVAHFFQELLGYLPSPMLYGLVITHTGGATSRWGMILLIVWSFQGLIYLSIATRYWKKEMGQQQPEAIEMTETNPMEAQLLAKQQSFPRLRSSSLQGKQNVAHFQHLFNPNEISMSLGYSQNMVISRASFDCSPNFRMQRSIAKRNTTMIQAVSGMAGLMGRVSINIDLDKDEVI